MDNRALIQRSLDYIEENLQTEITASELAQQAGFFFVSLLQTLSAGHRSAGDAVYPAAVLPDWILKTQRVWHRT